MYLFPFILETSTGLYCPANPTGLEVSEDAIALLMIKSFRGTFFQLIKLHISGLPHVQVRLKVGSCSFRCIIILLILFSILSESSIYKETSKCQ